jgi:hypothetical protein
MNIWERMPCEGTGITLDKLPMPPKPMTREVAIQIMAAELRYGKGTIRPALLAEAKAVLS